MPFPAKTAPRKGKQAKRAGLPPHSSRILLANCPHQAACSCSRAKGAGRDAIGKSPWIQAVIRTRLIAHAVTTCCRCALGAPRYRHRRSPNARTPCERVPSIPARMAYCCLNSTVACRLRAACRACHSACGRTAHASDARRACRRHDAGRHGNRWYERSPSRSGSHARPGSVANSHWLSPLDRWLAARPNES